MYIYTCSKELWTLQKENIWETSVWWKNKDIWVNEIKPSFLWDSQVDMTHMSDERFLTSEEICP